jgi:hypothetical protein
MYMDSYKDLYTNLQSGRHTNEQDTEINQIKQ